MMPHGHSTLKQGCLVARVVGKGGHMGVEVGGVSVDVTQNLVFEENLASLALKLVDHNQTHCAVPSLSKPPTHPCMHTFKHVCMHILTYTHDPYLGR